MRRSTRLRCGLFVLGATAALGGACMGTDDEPSQGDESTRQTAADEVCGSDETTGIPTDQETADIVLRLEDGSYALDSSSGESTLSVSFVQPVSADDLVSLATAYDTTSLTAGSHPFVGSSTFYSSYELADGESLDDALAAWSNHMQTDLERQLDRDGPDRQRIVETFDRVASGEVPMVRVAITGDVAGLVDALDEAGAQIAFVRVGDADVEAPLVEDPASLTATDDGCD